MLMPRLFGVPLKAGSEKLVGTVWLIDINEEFVVSVVRLPFRTWGKVASTS
jgi:hypothetical protein